MKKILIFGARGCIGKALTSALRKMGHEVRIVSRFPTREDLSWDPEHGVVDVSALEGYDVWVNLAGEPIAGLWTKRKMKAIRESRVFAQNTAVQALWRVKKKPLHYIAASAIGWYGSCEHVVDEKSGSGTGFLADVCCEWERPLEALQPLPVHVAVLRIGLVLSNEGGFLQKVLPSFRYGVGAYFGSGKQWTSVIAIDDLVGLSCYIIEKRLAGIYNGVCPHPVQHRALMESIGSVRFHIPAWLVDLLPHGMGKEIFLTSQRVFPEAALNAGFQFRYPTCQDALQHLLFKNSS